MQDIFDYADTVDALTTKAFGEIEWDCSDDNLAVRFFCDSSGNHFATVKGTDYLIAINQTCAESICSVWKGGLTGILEFASRGVDEALKYIQKQLPSHKVYNAQKKAGRITGRRSSV